MSDIEHRIRIARDDQLTTQDLVYTNCLLEDRGSSYLHLLLSRVSQQNC